jgi:hypothetical protein
MSKIREIAQMTDNRKEWKMNAGQMFRNIEIFGKQSAFPDSKNR